MVLEHGGKKLYHTTSNNFALVRYVDAKGNPVELSAGGTPALSWPDERACFPANTFMTWLVRRGRSRRNRGGTLHTYATQLSHLIRFCFSNRTDFIELTDNQFCLFVRGLSAKGNPTARSRENTRSPNTIRTICAISLEFLSFVGKLYGDPSFVSQQGSIRAERLQKVSGRRGSALRSTVGWEHHAMPNPGAERVRLPISAASIVKLRAAAAREKSSAFVRKRRLVLLTLLEVTGGRRAEVSEIGIDDISSALALDKPMLTLVTLKGGGTNSGRIRRVPIARHDLEVARDYIEFYRGPLVKSKCGNMRGDGKLLVSETTGLGLRANAVTQELWTLRKSANLAGQACAHMFRHRFITKLFVALIEQYEIENHDEFRRRLLSQGQLKQKIAEWTGHMNTASLDRYIHLAFEEIVDLKKVEDAAHLRLKVDSFKAQLVERQLDHVDPLLTKMLDAFRADLNDVLKEP